MAGPSATSNFAQAGLSAQRENERLLKATLENSPDYSKIVQESAVRKGREEIASAKAEQKVRKASLEQYTATKTKKEVDSAEMDYKKSKRKAGVLASAGGLLGAGMAGFAPSGRKKREIGVGDDKYNARTEKLRAGAADLRTQAEAIDVSGKASTSTTTNNSGSTVSSDISAQHAAGEGALSKQQIKQYAIDAGFSEQEAGTVVGIAGGESGYDPTNSTKRSGLHAKTGEDSVGLMQINWGYHKDSGWLQGLGINSREQLLDPATNMKAAKYLHSGRGNFGDWTVYNKGIYKDYL